MMLLLQLLLLLMLMLLLLLLQMLHRELTEVTSLQHGLLHLVLSS